MSKDNSIIEYDFSEEMKNSYRDYAVSVIIARALPDIRDGLKPVQRRVLYAMDELGLEPTKPHRKSARIVGDTMGKYHPHGDSSIYEALVHMTEDYSLSLPLVDGHGNFGSIDGDGAAAMRYTEARLSDAAMTLLQNLDMGLVEFQPNFDESEKEPMVLPATIPNLLINGTTGIAVGMATNIPPHNPVEVIEGTIAYMDNPEITTEGLMKYIKGPDFPTGGIITNADVLKEIYETGEGKIRVRAKVEVEKGDAGRKNLVVTEIPYTAAGRKTKLLEQLTGLMRDKVFDEIYDVRDESSKEGIRMVIEVKRDRDEQNLLNGLFKKTGLEDTYGVNLLAVKEKQPHTFSLKSMIREFVNFQEDIYEKKYKFLLEKAEKRHEVVEGLIKAVDIIDLIIEILRGSKNVAQAKACLIEGEISDIAFKSFESSVQARMLNFTEAQADAILSMQLSRLIGLELLKLHQENDDLLRRIAEYNLILGSKKELHKTIKAELKNYKRKFKQERKTELSNQVQSEYVEKIVEEDLYILIDRFGYAKSIDENTFNKADEAQLADYKRIIKIKNTDTLCLFTSDANMYKIKTNLIPKGRLRDKGVLIHTLCKIGNEGAVLYIPFEELFESQLVFVTRHGYVKRVSGIEFESGRNQINSSKLEEGDAIIYIRSLSTEDVIEDRLKVLFLTNDKFTLCYPVSEVNEYKKTSRGVTGIKLGKDDFVKYAHVVAPEDKSITVDAKEIAVSRFKEGKRADKGKKIRI
ncbi:MAG: DNA topoisomerase 4 subunit A [Lachnospiraceae bacterium]|nr:DNA topoisomerase 4 subunit A [Lachnospiraceae bacterium]